MTVPTRVTGCCAMLCNSICSTQCMSYSRTFVTHVIHLHAYTWSIDILYCERSVFLWSKELPVAFVAARARGCVRASKVQVVGER